VGRRRLTVASASWRRALRRGFVMHARTGLKHVVYLD
jgi:hypothetical protein